MDDPYDSAPDWWMALGCELEELAEVEAELAANDELRELAEAREALDWHTERTA